MKDEAAPLQANVEFAGGSKLDADRDELPHEHESSGQEVACNGSDDMRANLFRVRYLAWKLGAGKG